MPTSLLQKIYSDCIHLAVLCEKDYIIILGLYSSDSPTSKRRRMRMELLQELPGLAQTSANTVSDGDMTQEVITYYSTATPVCYSENAQLYWRDSSAKLPILSQL